MCQWLSCNLSGTPRARVIFVNDASVLGRQKQSESESRRPRSKRSPLALVRRWVAMRSMDPDRQVRFFSFRSGLHAEVSSRLVSCSTSILPAGLKYLSKDGE